MLSWIKGEVVEKQSNSLVVATQGIGYEVLVGESLVASVSLGQETALFTHLIIKQDGLDLYGFEYAFERTLFRKLMQVSGVGGKNALSLVSSLQAGEIIHSIEFNDPKTLTKAAGIGTRVASRIVSDLNGKLDDLDIGEGIPESEDMKTKQDAVGALIALGYPMREAGEAVNGAWVAEISVEELIKRALQRLNIR